jgi:hypothetical protein
MSLFLIILVLLHGSDHQMGYPPTAILKLIGNLETSAGTLTSMSYVEQSSI